MLNMALNFFFLLLAALFLSLQTISTLVVAAANVSGVYSCRAVNKVGQRTMNITFYVNGKWVTNLYREVIGTAKAFQNCAVERF